MPKINGTFICLHSCNSDLSPYYNPLEFTERLCLADCFNGGRPPASDTYLITNQAEIERRFGKIDTCKKLFFTESNSAHHISYFIAKRVFDQLCVCETSAKYLVINFDQHQDNGTMKGDFFCGSWGSRVTGLLHADYFIIGEKTRVDSHLFHSDPSVKALNYTSSNRSEFEKIITKINEYDKIYVTVDMDVLTDKDDKIQRTNWKHGNIKTDVLLGMLERLPAEKIVAADITGFPPKHMLSGESVPMSKKGELDSYILDIEAIAQALCNTMGILYEKD